MNPFRMLCLTCLLCFLVGCRRSPVGAESDAKRLVDEGVRKAAAGEFHEAIARYDEALRVTPDYALAYAQRGFARSAAGDREGSAEDLERAARLNLARWDRRIEAHPADTQAYLRRGFLRFELGDEEGALADYERAMSLDSSALAHFQRGHIRYRRGDKRGAIEDYTAALRLDPNLPEVYVSRAATYRDLGDSSAAAQDLARARSLAPDDRER
jgi:tetratricopeptide (TPR) repeat protein